VLGLKKSWSTNGKGLTSFYSKQRKALKRSPGGWRLIKNLDANSFKVLYYPFGWILGKGGFKFTP